MSRAVDIVGAELVAFLPNIRRFAISLTGSREQADDLVQQACERALAGADRFEPGTRFDAWIFRIVRNLWIDRLRRTRTAGQPDDIDDHVDLVGSHGVQDTEARLMLKSVSDAIADLPADQREVLLLTCVEDLSYREVAEILEIPIGTVMSRLARARRKLSETTGITGDAARLRGMKDGER